VSYGEALICEDCGRRFVQAANLRITPNGLAMQCVRCCKGDLRFHIDRQGKCRSKDNLHPYVSPMRRFHYVSSHVYDDVKIEVKSHVTFYYDGQFLRPMEI